MRRGAAAAMALVAAACTDSLDDRSDVRDLRILAIVAEPPELVLEGALPDVALTALVADPREPERVIDYAWTACGLTDDLRCASADFAADLGAGAAPLDGVAATMAVTPELLAAARELDTFQGFGGVALVAELVLAPGSDEELHAIKQVPAQLGLPEGTTPNANPTPPAVLHDGVAWPEDEVLEVAAGTEVAIEPVSPPEDAEEYSVYRFDLGVEDLVEYLDYDFFATAGPFSQGSTGGPPEIIETETSLSSRWTAPDEESDVTLWIVVRDGRGGLTWTSREVLVRGQAPAP